MIEKQMTEALEEDFVSHLQRISSIIGTVLIGIAAYWVVSARSAEARARRAARPVEELADELKQAWAGHHNR